MFFVQIKLENLVLIPIISFSSPEQPAGCRITSYRFGKWIDGSVPGLFLHFSKFFVILK